MVYALGELVHQALDAPGVISLHSGAFHRAMICSRATFSGRPKRFFRISTGIPLKVYNLIQALISPANPNEKSFDEILFVLEEHFSPQPPEIAKSNAFYKRNQKVGESIGNFVDEFRRLAQGCSLSQLDIMLRDRLVTGLRDEELQLHLFPSKKFDLRRISPGRSIISRSRRREQQNKLRCARAADAHTSDLSVVSETLAAEHVRKLLAKCDQSRLLSRKIRVAVVIENFPCEMEIDTGSEFTVLSEYVELVKVKGSCPVNVQYGNIHRTLTLIVAKGHCPNLLGLNWFEPLGIHLSGVHHMTSTPPQIS
ncbi:conserved hypothetical protein [Trichinella spiralis]|uniref:hypothetical protein n=1 Tax=Trichinella spiralis TaxID=6334 RepID=UPI0001EFB90C|nr:conserved hypothetical protein [Trichinella spiralis]